MAKRNDAQGIALVTGATGGMGAATVRALAEAGWDEFLLCDIDAGRLETVAAPLRSAGASVDVLAGNIADPGHPGEIVKALKGRPISAAVHTAGIGPSGGPPAIILDVNYAATIRFVEAIRDHMTNGSAAVLIASNSAHFPLPSELAAAARRARRPEDVASLVPLCPDGTVAYPLSKYGVMHVVQREAAGFGARGARINSISPGATDTAMVASEREHGRTSLDDMLCAQPIPRIAQPEEMAAIATFLCSPDASFITAADILADGGMINALVPRD